MGCDSLTTFRPGILFLIAAIVFWGAACQQIDNHEEATGSLSAEYSPSPAGAECKMPQPTQHWLDSDAETRNKAARREYVEMMHSAAPGVDWRAIEQQNGLDAMERKRQARRDPPARSRAAYWRELGSRNLSGRMHTAAWSPDGQTLYGGSDRGGIWKSDLDGNSWTPLGDNLYGGAYEIVVLPGDTGNPDILLRLYSNLVHRSDDLGQTWVVPTGTTGLQNTKRVVVLDDGSSTVFLLVQKSGYWRILRSINKGGTFALVRTLTNCGDVWTPRDALGPLYVADGDQIYETSDQGQTWNTVGGPMPVSGTKTILAGSEAPALRFNTAVLNNSTWELWRSENAGQSWTYLRDLDDFWESLVASSTDGDLIAYAGVEMFLSRNGGGSWNKVNTWPEYYNDPVNKLHADVPGLFVFSDPTSPTGEMWYVGTDGGLYESADQIATVNNLSLSGLGVSQYYSVHTSRRDPDLVLAGSQDQGYQRSVLNGPPPPPPGPWADFDQLISGDYGHITSSNGAHDLVYSVYPGFVLVQEGEENPDLLYPWVDFPSGSSHLWLPYIQADPDDQEAFFFCANKLYRYKREFGSSWSYTQHSAQSFSPFLSAIAFSPIDTQRAYAVTSDGELYYSNDGAVTWTLSPTPGPGAHYFYGTVLLPSSTNKNVCWAAGSGYSNPPVYRTMDGGRNWLDMSDGLPSTLVYCMAEAPDQSGVLFCGSDQGAWRFDPATSQWSDILGTDAPICTYWTCEAVPSRNVVRFGTYGRGIWDYHLETPGCFPYGELRGGANVLALGCDAPPLIGQSIIFQIDGCLPGALGKLVLSAEAAEEDFLGGTLLVDLPATYQFPFSANASGTALVTINIPDVPGLVGQERFLQAGAEDANQPNGWALSHGLRAVVGE